MMIVFYTGDVIDFDLDVRIDVDIPNSVVRGFRKNGTARRNPTFIARCIRTWLIRQNCWRAHAKAGVPGRWLNCYICSIVRSSVLEVLGRWRHSWRGTRMTMVTVYYCVLMSLWLILPLSNCRTYRRSWRSCVYYCDFSTDLCTVIYVTRWNS